MSLLVSDLIDAARIRHWSFTDVALGDGAVLLYLNQRQRAYMAQYGASLEGILGKSSQNPVNSATAVRVALSNGVPLFTAGVLDGYLQQYTIDGFPFYDTGTVLIAGDPFQQAGGTAGFPMPADLLRLISVGLIHQGINIPCELIAENERFERVPGRHPSAYLSNNRLIPITRAAPMPTSDRWFGVTSIVISYVPVPPVLTATASVVVLPDVLGEALTSDVAALFAGQSRDCTPIERAAFRNEATRCAAAIAEAASDMLGAVQQSSIIFRQ
jgi:hypothetical protein